MLRCRVALPFLNRSLRAARFCVTLRARCVCVAAIVRDRCLVLRTRFALRCRSFIVCIRVRSLPRRFDFAARCAIVARLIFVAIWKYLLPYRRTPHAHVVVVACRYDRCVYTRAISFAICCDQCLHARAGRRALPFAIDVAMRCCAYAFYLVCSCRADVAMLPCCCIDVLRTRCCDVASFGTCRVACDVCDVACLLRR